MPTLLTRYGQGEECWTLYSRYLLRNFCYSRESGSDQIVKVFMRLYPGNTARIAK